MGISPSLGSLATILFVYDGLITLERKTGQKYHYPLTGSWHTNHHGLLYGEVSTLGTLMLITERTYNYKVSVSVCKCVLAQPHCCLVCQRRYLVYRIFNFQGSFLRRYFYPSLIRQFERGLSGFFSKFFYFSKSFFNFFKTRCFLSLIVFCGTLIFSESSLSVNSS